MISQQHTSNLYYTFSSRLPRCIADTRQKLKFASPVPSANFRIPPDLCYFIVQNF